jgi:hypothetical protein
MENTVRMTPQVEEPQTTALSSEIRDIDRDSLHILPLSIIPLQTPALTGARMIKNVRLESVVELFGGPNTGSGQVDIEDLPRAFGWGEARDHPDLMVIRRLALLPSFDMYSLRILLREHGIPISDCNALRLSARKNAELTEYMTRFTRPLIMHVYAAAADRSIQSFEGLVALFRDPNIEKALGKLKIMAARLEIRVDQVPKFLEDYGDIFLSLSYYRQALDSIEPNIAGFDDVIGQLRRHWQLRKDANLMKTCTMIEEVLKTVMARLKGRFTRFDECTADLWSNVSAERFRKVQDLIASYHTTIGAVLCALAVKMDAWRRMFPSQEAGGPMKQANFIFTEMRPGFDRILRLERMAPTSLDLAL